MGYFSEAERRSHPSNPDAWFINGVGGHESAAGVAVDQETALSSSAILQGVRLVSETVGRVPLGIYQRLARGRELLRDHPTHRVLNHPNGEITSVEMRSMVQSFAITAGVGYAEIVFRDGRPEELWPIPPHRVKAERSPKGTLRFRVKADDGTEYLVPMENMLVIPGFQRGGLLGIDLVAKMQESIGLTLATERFGAAFFGNSTVLSGFLKGPGKFSKEAKDNFRESFNRRHQGVEKAHRIGFLEEGLEWVSAGIAPEAAQFLETRSFQVDEAARILNVPPHLLWHLERATFNNIEELGIAFVTYSLDSWWVRWEQRVGQRLLLPSERDAGLYAKHTRNELLAGSPEKRGEYYKMMFNTGAFGPNDILELEDRNPIEGGDRRFIPMNMIPLDRVDDGLDVTLPDDDEPEPDDEGDEEENTPAVLRPLLLDRQRTAHARLFTATADSVIRRELSMVRTALKKSRGGRDLSRLKQETDSAYEGHAAWVAERMLPVASVYLTALAGERDVPVDVLARACAAEIAGEWVAESVGALEGVRVRAVDDMEPAVESLLDQWQSKRAHIAATDIMGRLETKINKEVPHGA